MAVATYTTDLTDIADLDTTGGTAVEPATLYTAGRSPIEDDVDFPIQGTVHASLTQNATGKGGILVPGNTGWSSGDYIFGWIIWLAPSTIATYASGGLVMIVGDSASVFRVFYVGGSDYGVYPYGGWQNFVVDPESTPDENAGTPTTFSYVGCGANCITKVSKGNPLGFDVFRYGRGESRIAGGTLTDTDASFSGFAAVNDNNSNRWGLFQQVTGGYLMKGKVVIGYAAICDFTDSDLNINIDRTDWVDADFNRFEITNASSVVNWTNINITCTDPVNTLSKGRLEMMDNATFNDTGGAFTDMDTFIYQSNATITSRTFRRCGQITHGGATFDSCVFEGYEGTAGTGYLTYNVASDINGEIDYCSFTMGTALTHAIQFGTSTPSTMTLTGVSVSGYGADNLDSSVLYFPDKGSDTDWIVNLVGCSGTFTYDKARTGDTVTFVIDPIAITITVKDIVSGNLLENARVLVTPTDSTNFIYQEAFTFTGSGTSATATIGTGTHGLSTGDEVAIAGVSDDAYNGTFTVTVTSTTVFTYTTVDTITTSSLSGNVTMALISKLTNASGVATESYSISSDQPIAGRVRLSSAVVDSETAYFKQSLISGSVGSTSGFSATIQMVRDE